MTPPLRWMSDSDTPETAVREGRNRTGASGRNWMEICVLCACRPRSHTLLLLILLRLNCLQDALGRGVIRLKTQGIVDIVARIGQRMLTQCNARQHQIGSGVRLRLERLGRFLLRDF